MTKFLYGKIICPLALAASLAVPVCECFSIEVISQKSDTFIFEGIPDGEFSKSDFIAVAHVEEERAIAYLPMEFKAESLGINAESDDIALCSLVLYIKSAPPMPDSNANESGSREEKKRAESEGREGAEAPYLPSAEESAEKISEAEKRSIKYGAEKLEAAQKDKIRIAVYGIVDGDTFEPNSKNFRVSWDGKHDAPAPKHNTREFDAEAPGLAKLGTIELDAANEDYDDGDRIEFTSPELVEFVSFCYGMISAKGKEPKFKTSEKSVRRGCIVLVQEEGHSGIFFYSADSLGDEVGKAQSGDEKSPEENMGKDKENFDSPKISERTVPPLQEKASTATPQRPDVVIPSVLAKKEKKLSELVWEKYVYKKGQLDENCELDGTPDRRPRIVFEYVRRDENAAAGISEDAESHDSDKAQ